MKEIIELVKSSIKEIDQMYEENEYAIHDLQKQNKKFNSIRDDLDEILQLIDKQDEPKFDLIDLRKAQ